MRGAVAGKFRIILSRTVIALAMENLSPSARPTSHKGERIKSYTHDFKIRAINLVKGGQSVRSVAKNLSVDPKCVRRWMQQETNLKSSKNQRVERRLAGGGRKAHFPRLEQHLLQKFKSLRDQNQAVTYRLIQEETERVRDELQLPSSFKVSNKFVYLWTRRHGITSRRITHQAQITSTTAEEVKHTVLKHLKDVEAATINLSPANILNMDQVPCWFDMCRTSTLHFKGDKNVESAHTGNMKTRFTVAITSRADGSMKKAMIVFKNLVKPPKITNCPRNVIVDACKSGSMATHKVLEWANLVLRRGPFANERQLLLLDSYGPHCSDELSTILRKFNVDRHLIPPRLTFCLQPNDVGINLPFKAGMRREWQEWALNGPKEFTPKGYRKRPSYDAIVQMVSRALLSVRPETVMNAFTACGVAAGGQAVATNSLNSHLRRVLGGEDVAADVTADADEESSESLGEESSSDDDHYDGMDDNVLCFYNE